VLNQKPTYEISNREIELAPRLLIEVLESPTLPKNTSFEINAAGYIGSKRRARDGYTYMGTADLAENLEDWPNDIIIPVDELGMGNIHLVIQYRPDDKAYYIKDYGQGTGTFVKIEKPVVLKEEFIVSYGESHMQISALREEKIQLKFLDGSKSDQILYFSLYPLVLFILLMVSSKLEECLAVILSLRTSVYQGGSVMCFGRMGSGYLLMVMEISLVLMAHGISFITHRLFVEDPFKLEDSTIFKAGQSLFLVKVLPPKY